MTIHLYHNDLPAHVTFGSSVAIDTETMGLNPHRDRLCVMQLSGGDGHAHLVKFDNSDFSAPHLRRILSDDSIEKIFHFARFDVAVIQLNFEVELKSIYCTKIASRLARTFTDKHGLKDLCRELLSIEVNKNQQTSDWGAPTLTEEQKIYAAGDVLYLHQLRTKLDEMLGRVGRAHLAKACFEFLPSRAALDLAGWDEFDIFAH